MATPRKQTDDHADKRPPVPPYPAEVSGTWQAFRVTVSAADDDDTDEANGDARGKPVDK